MSKRAMIWLKVLDHEKNFWMGLLDSEEEGLSDKENGILGPSQSSTITISQIISSSGIKKTFTKDSETIFIPRQHLVFIGEVSNEASPLGFVTGLKRRRSSRELGIADW